MPRFLPALMSLSLLLLPGVCRAEEKAPVDANTIIEALKPPQREPMRTRNLMIRPNAPAESGSSANINIDNVPSAAANPGATGAVVMETPPARPQISLAIPFDFNSARLSPEGAKALDQVGKALSSDQLSGLKFGVEGHTDAKGSAAYNQKLSQARAEEVRRYLTTIHGVDGSRLIAVGKGSSELAAPNDPLAAENRRVRIVTLLK